MNPVIGLRKSQNRVESNQINFSQGLDMTINEYAGIQIRCSNWLSCCSNNCHLVRRSLCETTNPAAVTLRQAPPKAGEEKYDVMKYL